MTEMTIAHLSDLHIGRVDERVKAALLKELRHNPPTLIVISGDIVQRATTRNFCEARNFLTQLPAPVLIVPGNHDIPVYNLVRRFYRPFEKYHRYICRDLFPVYEGSGIVVVGVSSVHAWHWNFVEGRIDPKQLHHLCTILQKYPKNWIKILVIHHPFVFPPHARTKSLIRGGKQAIPILVKAGVNLLLSGHLHHHCIADAAVFHNLSQYSLLVSLVSTTTSTRLRQYPNSYTRIIVSPSRVVFYPRIWTNSFFDMGVIETYQQYDKRWYKV